MCLVPEHGSLQIEAIPFNDHLRIGIYLYIRRPTESLDFGVLRSDVVPLASACDHPWSYGPSVSAQWEVHLYAPPTR